MNRERKEGRSKRRTSWQREEQEPRPQIISAPPPLGLTPRQTPKRPTPASPRGSEARAPGPARTLTLPRPPGSGSATLPLHRVPSAAAGWVRAGTREPEVLTCCARQDL